MNTALKSILCVLVAVGGFWAYRHFSTGGSGTRAAMPAVFTSTDLRGALQSSGQPGGKSVVVANFTASWCPPCQQMKKNTWPDNQVQSWFSKNATAVYVDADQNGDLAGHYRIQGIPTIIVFRDGQEVGRVTGGLSPQDLLAFLAKSVN